MDQRYKKNNHKAEPSNNLQSRITAIELLQSIIIDRKWPSNACSDSKNYNGLSEQDKKFAYQIVMCALRNYHLLKYIINQHLHSPLKAKYINAEYIMIISAAQLIFMKTPDYAAIDSGVRLAKHTDINLPQYIIRLINAVLRNIARAKYPNSISNIPAENYYPKWLYDKLNRQYGKPEANRIIDSCKYEPKFDVQFSSNSHAQKFANHVLDKNKPNSPSSALKLLDETYRFNNAGEILTELETHSKLDQAKSNHHAKLEHNNSQYHWWVQDFAASLPIELAMPIISSESNKIETAHIAHIDNSESRKTFRVIDLCAAPGGKLLQIIRYFNNHYDSDKNIDITALEIQKDRYQLLQESIARVEFENKTNNSLVNISCHNDDVTQFVENETNSKTSQDKYDFVLLDSPCSASGTIRRHPEWLIHNDNDNELAQIVKYQQKLLQNAYELMTENGWLLYITCSIFAEENQQQIKWFLQQYDDIAIYNLSEQYQKINNNSKQQLSDDIITTQGNLVITPACFEEIGYSDGIFACLMQRAG